MNKQEAIKKVEQMGEYERFVNESIPKLSVLNILNQLDEPEKVKIPQFVADWIEKSRLKGWDLLSSMCFTLNDKDKKTIKWLHLGENVNIFAHAWLDGYEVEKEKRYLVKMKGVDSRTNYLYYGVGSKSWLFKTKLIDGLFRKSHTSKELEQDNFGWVFDCEGIEIEEVTD
nr:MAG TPA: Protein of unknown function (DUF1642) [Caudoviricetes sp.]